MTKAFLTARAGTKVSFLGRIRLETHAHYFLIFRRRPVVPLPNLPAASLLGFFANMTASPSGLEAVSVYEAGPVAQLVRAHA